MPKLTAANCKVLANAKKLYAPPVYAEIVYANCIRHANGPGGVPHMLAYLSRIAKTTVTEASLAAAVASLPDRAREAAAAGKRLPVGATRA